MILEISTKRRLEIKEAVYNTLLLYGTPILPVKIGAIIRNIKYIKLITYSSQIKKHGIPYEELIFNAETKDSYAVRQGSTGRFCIYYNDIDHNIVSSNRVRWNLAHELGHIILNHHETIGVNKLYRGLDNDTYVYLEKEADYFAALLLVPHAAISGFKITHHNHIRYLCKISEPAAKRRFWEYKEWRAHVDGNDAYDQRIFSYYFNFIYKRNCKVCGASLIQRYGKHCPICGSKNTLEWGDGKMIYDKLDSRNGKVKICPVCHNEETEIEGDYCQICGISLRNKCSDYRCDNNDTLPTNARFCPICGSVSTFYNADILQAWNKYIAEPFSNVPDEQVDYSSVPLEGLPF